MMCRCDYIKVVLLLLVNRIVCISGRQISECHSSATCQALNECSTITAFLDQLDKPLTPPVVDFLRSQQCGFSKGFPKVCCTTVPKKISALKHARNTNRLSEFDDDFEEGKKKPRSNNNRLPQAQKIDDFKEKSKKINEAFSSGILEDYFDSLDLFRRRRSSDDGDLEIEVR